MVSEICAIRPSTTLCRGIAVTVRRCRRNREDLVFQRTIMGRWAVLLLTSVALTVGYAFAQQGERGQSSYLPVDITEPFTSLMARLSAEKPSVEQVHNSLLNDRYDLSDRPAQGVTMDRTKPLQEGVRVKLPAGVTWESLAAMTPDQIASRICYQKAFIHCRIQSTRRAASSFRTSSLTRS